MIRNADVIERLELLLGKELTIVHLHETIFCEEKHQKIRRRFNVGKYNYIQFKFLEQNNYVDITILGNPNTFRIGVEEKDGTWIVQTAPRISYTYI